MGDLWDILVAVGMVAAAGTFFWRLVRQRVSIGTMLDGMRPDRKDSCKKPAERFKDSDIGE